MWIEIKSEVFEEADFRILNFILQLLMWTPNHYVDRYNVLVDSDAVDKTENYRKLRSVDRLLFQKQFEDFSNNTETIKYIITLKENKSINEFSLEEAVRFFNQPILIVVENSLNDGYFLQTIFRHFGKKIQGSSNQIKLVEFLKNDWIQFVNAGGWTNIKNYVKGKLKTYNHLPAAYTDEQHKYLRCFVLIDSDKRYPTQVIGTDKQSLEKWLDERNVKIHILKKRAMENYMPDEVIQKIPTLKTSYRQFKFWIKAYTRISDKQKDFLNYNKGFSKKDSDKRSTKSRNELHQEVQNLYADLTESQYDALDKGLQIPKFKDDFPALFEEPIVAHAVRKDSLLKREGGTDTSNEFLEILQKINDLL